MVSAKGDISAVIGSGSAGFAADGSPARGAALNDPEYLLVRDDGSLVISDRGNGRVIAIDADGEVRTLAGRKSNGK